MKLMAASKLRKFNNLQHCCMVGKCSALMNKNTRVVPCSKCSMSALSHQFITVEVEVSVTVTPHESPVWDKSVSSIYAPYQEFRKILYYSCPLPNYSSNPVQSTVLSYI